MKEPIVEELVDVLRVIGMLQLRESTLREDLQFFINNYNPDEQGWIGAYKRLEHEAMFLCVDAYSMHQGISKKKSLYSKIIKQNSKEFLKIDRQPITNVEHLGINGEDGLRPATNAEVAHAMKAINAMAIDSRKKSQEEVGIQSHKSPEMDNWIESVVDEETLFKLSEYRKKFAHRLDSLEHLKQELEVYHSKALQEMLDVVASVLEQYYSCIQKILEYATSTHYSAKFPMHYSSLGRIKLWKEWQQRQSD
ncbi:hypothetical protein SPB21_18900 [Leptothoe sp. ISB3NOV94-8A]